MKLKKPAIAGAALALAAIGAWRFGGAGEALPGETSAVAAAAGASSAWLSPTAGELPADGAVSAASAASADASGAGVTLVSAAQLPPIAAVRGLRQCYFADSCGGSPDDTLGTHFAVSEQISKRLAALDPNGPNSAGSAELAALAREFMSFPDGHVQAAALALAARLPADAGTFGAVVSALGDSYDQLLFRKALPVLQQWQSQGLSSGVDDMLYATLRTGGIHAAQVVAEGLTPFVNDANLARYEALAAQMPAGARQTALLRSLRDYRLQKSGA